MPGVVVVWHVTDTPIPEPYRIEMANYLLARQNPDDGGWGLHIEGRTSVYGTAMNYTTLRLLGVGPEEPRMVRARAQLHRMGGAVNAPLWGKFLLCVLGVAGWDLMNPVPPELWWVNLCEGGA